MGTRAKRQNGKRQVRDNQRTIQGNEQSGDRGIHAPRSFAIASKGIHTSHDYAAMMDAVTCDVLTQTLSRQEAAVVISAQRAKIEVLKLKLKQMRYANPKKHVESRSMNLLSGSVE